MEGKGTQGLLDRFRRSSVVVGFRNLLDTLRRSCGVIFFFGPCDSYGFIPWVRAIDSEFRHMKATDPKQQLHWCRYLLF